MKNDVSTLHEVLRLENEISGKYVIKTKSSRIGKIMSC